MPVQNYFKIFISCNLSNQLKLKQGPCSYFEQGGELLNNINKTRGWGYVSPLLAGAVPCLVVPRVGCVVPIPLSRPPGGCPSAPLPLVFAPGWYSLRIATVTGGSVAVVGHAVVTDVLPGVGYVISALKIERKNNS